MEIVKDDVTGDLYKNGEKYQRINMTNSNENNQDTRSESKSGFSFHAKGTDVHSSDVLISSRTNSETHKEVSTSGADFKYHANGDVEYSVITTNRSEGSRSRMSPDYNDRVEQARKQNNSNVNLKDKTQNSKTISLSSLQQIKPPSRPVTKGKVSVNQDQNSKDKPVSRQSDWTKDDKSRTTSPERQGALKTPSSQNKTRQNDPKSNIGKDKITSKRTASPEKGILKKPVSSRKPGDSTDNTKQKDVTTENVDAIIVKESIARTVTNQTNATYISEERLHKDSSETNNGNNSSTHEVTPEDKVQNEEHVNGNGADEKQQPHKQTPTRFPPTGKNTSLIGNGDVKHQRLPPANKNSSLVGKPNGDISNTKTNGSNKRHLSTIPKNEVSTPHSTRSQVKEKNGDVDKMSEGSISSNRTKPANVDNRVVSPKTDTTDYRITNPRSVRRENGPLLSPRTDKSYDSRNSSQSRVRSKEFTFRWNAPSRNTSPEATDKASSPPLKQYKPSAQIQSFYSYLYGRSKKRKEAKATTSKPKGILVKNDPLERERPSSFVFLRSKTVQRSAWDKNPAELTYKPSTNGPEEISHAYVGEDSIRDAEMTARLQQMQQKSSKQKEDKVIKKRSNIPPWHENEYVLNRRQAGVYRNMSNTYGAESKRQREQRFVQKLAEYEVYKAKQQWEELLDKEKKKRETKERQVLQLNELRQRFEDEAFHRFHTQYVTSRVLEHEKMNRNEYGLPEDAEDEPENRLIIKRKKVVPKSLITEEMVQDIYKKKFNKIFDVNKGNGLGRRPKTPKMEGIDTVVLEEKDSKDEDKGRHHDAGISRNTRERKRMVKDVINEAEKQLKVNKQERKKLSTPTGGKDERDDRTPSMKDLDLDDDSDDDDMDDIFEKARRKYELDVDD